MLVPLRASQPSTVIDGVGDVVGWVNIMNGEGDNQAQPHRHFELFPYGYREPRAIQASATGALSRPTI